MPHFEEFTTLFQQMFYKENLFDGYALAGMDFQTAYFQWLADKLGLPRENMLIDKDACVYGVPIYREMHLRDCDPHITGVVPGGAQEYMNMFRRNGIHTASIEREFGCRKFGFYEWLEAKYGVDLATTVPVEDIVGAGPGTTASGPSRQMGLYDVLKTIRRPSAHTFLDIGCGKGGAMVIANQFGFDCVDGLEISTSLCNIAMRNLDLLAYDGKVINQSAIDFDGYGEYDILYMYDPFRGDLFRWVMDQIEKCIGTKPAILIYANPYHHKDVVANGVFKLEKLVDTDFFHRNVKIYTANGASI